MVRAASPGAPSCAAPRAGSSVVEHPTFNRVVVGSTPTRPTNLPSRAASAIRLTPPGSIACAPDRRLGMRAPPQSDEVAVHALHQVAQAVQRTVPAAQDSGTPRQAQTFGEFGRVDRPVLPAPEPGLGVLEEAQMVADAARPAIGVRPRARERRLGEAPSAEAPGDSEAAGSGLTE